MKKIVYSPDAADKFRAINRAILIQYGSQKSKQIVGKILKVIKGLALHEEMGASVSAIFGIDSDYRYIYVSKNYVFYSIEADCIRIINIYNEKEDFMWLLFGLDESNDFTEL